MKPLILVVDDAEDGREMLVEYLVFRQFPVEAARDGREAVEMARRMRPHVVLMDLSMPYMDGWEATRQLKADPLTKDALIVALTAHAFAKEQEEARKSGCDVVVPKPYDLTTLADALDRVLTDGARAFARKDIAMRGTRRATVGES